MPASVLALLDDLRAAGYAVAPTPPSSRALLETLDAEISAATLSIDAYARLLAALPPEVAERITAAWGEPAGDADVRDGAFHFRAHAFGNISVALAPIRADALPSLGDT